MDIHMISSTIITSALPGPGRLNLEGEHRVAQANGDSLVPGEEPPGLITPRQFPPSEGVTAAGAAGLAEAPSLEKPGEAAVTTAPTEAPPEGDTVAKKAVIQQLFNEKCTVEDRKLLEDALLSYSLDNLLLLAEHKVSYYVRTIRDMPAAVKSYFQNAHRDQVESTARQLAKQCGEDYILKKLKTMPYEEKVNYIKATIRDNELDKTFTSATEVVGTYGKVSWKNADDFDEVTPFRGLCAIDGTRVKGIYLIRHCLTQGVIIHETAHALDMIKHPETDSSYKLKKVLGMLTSPFGSERDSALVAHMENYLEKNQDEHAPLWSRYIALKGEAKEYLAEAVRVYLTDPDKLRDQDPELFEFARGFALTKEYPKLAEEKK